MQRREGNERREREYDRQRESIGDDPRQEKDDHRRRRRVVQESKEYTTERSIRRSQRVNDLRGDQESTTASGGQRDRPRKERHTAERYSPSSENSLAGSDRSQYSALKPEDIQNMDWSQHVTYGGQDQPYDTARYGDNLPSDWRRESTEGANTDTTMIPFGQRDGAYLTATGRGFEGSYVRDGNRIGAEFDGSGNPYGATVETSRFQTTFERGPNEGKGFRAAGKLKKDDMAEAAVEWDDDLNLKSAKARVNDTWASAKFDKETGDTKSVNLSHGRDIYQPDAFVESTEKGLRYGGTIGDPTHGSSTTFGFRGGPEDLQMDQISHRFKKTRLDTGFDDAGGVKSLGFAYGKGGKDSTRPQFAADVDAEKGEASVTFTASGNTYSYSTKEGITIKPAGKLSEETSTYLGDPTRDRRNEDTKPRSKDSRSRSKAPRRGLENTPSRRMIEDAPTRLDDPLRSMRDYNSRDNSPREKEPIVYRRGPRESGYGSQDRREEDRPRERERRDEYIPRERERREEDRPRERERRDEYIPRERERRDDDYRDEENYRRR